MLLYWIWYATLAGMSLRQKLTLLEHFSEPEEIFHTEKFSHIPGITQEMECALENKDLTYAGSILHECSEKKIGILTLQDAAYPRRLRNISNPPLVLYYKGILPDFEGQPVIAVVGTRKASAYGMTTARQMSGEIAASGGLVVSGGAYGVDTAALQGALDAGKKAVAVLGCGADVVYPPTNRALFERVEQSGCIMSEYVPGTKPERWQFPERNRILSGLSNGVLVVEAPEKSGALITAREAFEQGRDVFAIPGNIGVASGMGSNRLLQDYGSAVLSGWDVLKDYAPQYPGVEKKAFTPRPDNMAMPLYRVAQAVVSPGGNSAADKKFIDNPATNAYSVVENENTQTDEMQAKILRCIGDTPTAVDDVILQSGMPAAEVLRVLTKLSIKGLVVNHPGGQISARK